MNLRALMLAHAGMGNEPLCSDLPKTWSRAQTQEVYNKFLETEFPNPATASVSLNEI